MGIKFTPRQDAQTDDEYRRTLTGEAMGYASTCWDPTPEGVFQSQLAADAGEELDERLAELKRSAQAVAWNMGNGSPEDAPNPFATADENGNPAGYVAHYLTPDGAHVYLTAPLGIVPPPHIAFHVPMVGTVYAEYQVAR